MPAISALPLAVLADVTPTDLLCLVDMTGAPNVTKRVTMATMREWTDSGENASGVDVAATPRVIVAPLSTGAANPSGFVWGVGTVGVSGSTPQTQVPAWLLGETENASGVEVFGWNPSGPLVGGLPIDHAVALREAGDGGRFANRLKLFRVGQPAAFRGGRVNTSFSAPSAVLSGETLFNFEAMGWDGSEMVPGARLGFQTTANWSVTDRASAATMYAVRPGATTVSPVLTFGSPSSGVATLTAGQAILRFVPGATSFVIRNSADTVDAHSFAADGLTAAFAQGTAGSCVVTIGASTLAFVAVLNVRAAAGQTRDVRFQAGTSSRWALRATNTAEGGANTGSDFTIVAFNDAAVTIDSPVSIIRAANGAITLGGSGNRQVIIAGTAWGAGVASLRLNGLTSGAAANLGTLANSPAAGDPAFWMPVNIAGTVRYIPCW